MMTTTALQSRTDLRIREYEPMARHTNFRIGGPARYYVEARTPEEVTRAVAAARDAGIPWFALGGGSNTLVADVGFDGLVIQLADRGVSVDGTRVTAGAGAISAAVARAAGDAGLTGFEWAISLPGTIGGAVRGNAGCFGGEMMDVVESISFFSPSRGEGEGPVLPKLSGSEGGEGVGVMTNVDCGFHYRHSTFKDHPEWIVLEVTLMLQPGDPVECRRHMDEHLMRRKIKQPLERPSAGCLFSNVECKTLNAEQLERLDRTTDGAWRQVSHDGQLPTGWLIERLGLKGHRVGNVMVSEKHGNFVINLGGGTAADVLALIDHVQGRTHETFGIELREEVQRLGC
ncbi:UDP-N-acetylmuramate dehydrogenase [Candidatus Uhrbacteria bacterium]|nr:UDP-N-acetylmuramate dehydrogenase [Candidatus Uhrbacteria bacterium]